MGFREVTSLDADTTVALGGFNKKTKKDNPTSAEGYYLGTREVTSTKGKNGKSKIHFLQTPKGNLGVWGKTDMDRKLASVTPGTMIRITHTGMQATPNGEMYKFRVEIDEDNTIDVSSLQTGATEDTGTDEEAYSDDEETTEEEPQYNAAADQEARRRKVQDMLNKGKR